MGFLFNSDAFKKRKKSLNPFAFGDSFDYDFAESFDFDDYEDEDDFERLDNYLNDDVD